MISYIKTIPKRLWVFLSIAVLVFWTCATDSTEGMENEPWMGVWSELYGSR